MYLNEQEFIRQALKEDIGRGDLFVRVTEPKAVKGFVLAKSDGVFAGEVYLKGDKLVLIEGNSKSLLSLERTILNILHHASSIATLTNRFVQKISKYGVKLLDTRKTRPLLREFEKYAVRCGGGVNHRMGFR